MIIYSQGILYLVTNHMILKHHVLLPVFHVSELVLLHRPLILQRKWDGIAELISGKLYGARAVATDQGAAPISGIVVGTGQIASGHAVVGLVGAVHAGGELAVPALHFVHFVVDVVVVVAEAIVAAEAGEARLATLSLFRFFLSHIYLLFWFKIFE